MGALVSDRLKTPKVVPGPQRLHTILTAGTSKAGWKPALRPKRNPGQQDAPCRRRRAHFDTAPEPAGPKGSDRLLPQSRDRTSASARAWR